MSGFCGECRLLVASWLLLLPAVLLTRSLAALAPNRVCDRIIPACAWLYAPHPFQPPLLPWQLIRFLRLPLLLRFDACQPRSPVTWNEWQALLATEACSTSLRTGMRSLYELPMTSQFGCDWRSQLQSNPAFSVQECLQLCWISQLQQPPSWNAWQQLVSRHAQTKAAKQRC